MTAGAGGILCGTDLAWYEVRTSADWLARRHGGEEQCKCTQHPPEFCRCHGDCECHYRAVWKTELEP